MADAGRQDGDVARLQLDGLPLGAAELDLGAAARNAQHLVRAGMAMQEVVDAVAPAIAPAVPGEGLLEGRRGIASGFDIERAAIEDQRQLRIIRRLAVATPSTLTGTPLLV